ncbi:MAG: hypothetical protein IPO27_08720 [Bacteroidetes bacterium]|nr:hypothetical protein [Bacteroidota bacterium]
MINYIRRILNNCQDASAKSLMQGEVQLSIKQRFELWLHILFCNCCKNFVHQSRIIDQSIKLLKKKADSENPEYKASPQLKDKLEKIIS